MAISYENSLDQILDYAQCYGINTVCAKEISGCHFPYNANAVIYGPFAMQVHCHDTGNGVSIYILGAGDPYQIVDTTYWKRPGYEHNPDKWEHGAWDGALDAAIASIGKLVSKHREALEARRNEVESVKQNAADVRKHQVEALFAREPTA